MSSSLNLNCRLTISYKIFFFLLVTAILCPLLICRGFGQGLTPGPAAAEAEALIQAGHWKRARAVLEPQVKAHPDDPRDNYLLAKVKTAFNDLDGALPLAQRAVSLDEKNSDFHLELGKIYGRMAAEANIFAAGPLAVKFRKEVETAVDLNSGNLDALDSMMQFKIQAPALMGGDKGEALALAEKIESLNPSEGYLAGAELADLQKNPKDQEALLMMAAKANPENYGALTALARFDSQPPHAKHDEAVKDAHSAQQLDPARIGAYKILARVFAVEQRWVDLDQVLALAGKNVPDDLSPFYEAAQALLETGKDFPRAEGYAKKYLSQEPEGEEPDTAEAHRLLGLLFEKEDRNAEARAEVQTALQLRPNFKAAKDDLKRLEY
jgi:hypothetical protein